MAATDKDTTDWREGLLRKLQFIVVGAWVLTALVILNSSRTVHLQGFGVATLVLLAIVVFVLTQTRLSTRLRAGLVIFGMTLVALPSYLIVGFSSGPSLVVALCVVLTSLLLGWRASLLYLAFLVATLLAFTVALWAGLWEGPLISESSVSDPMVWLRISALSAVLWASISYVIYWVVNAIERSLTNRESALMQLRQEVSQRQDAERAQRDAENTANQLQRLESLGQLAAGVAHDFNNALLVIQGWNDLLRGSKSPADREQGYDAIQQATDQAGQLARQLLTFARQDIRCPKYLLIDKLLADTVATLGPLLAPPVLVDVETEPGAAIFADETQMRQMLFNLIINARDAMPQGGQIRVRGQCIAADDVDEKFSGIDRSNIWVKLSIEDQGSGMDEATRERIFEPFFTTKKMGSGSGLGLSTVFGIVTQSGGHISVSTRVSQGTSFTVYLPAVQVAPKAATQNILPSPLIECVSQRVLVLEDDALARDFISFALRQAGMSIMVVQDGDEALKFLHNTNNAIDVLCTDAVFPGAPLSEVIGAFERVFPNGHVVVCSGYVRENLTISGLESGDYDFLAKPFTATQLVQKITSVGRRNQS